MGPVWMDRARPALQSLTGKEIRKHSRKEKEMTKSVLAKVVWVSRATTFCVGLAVVLAVVFGAASTALAAVPGDPFRLGQLNTIDRVSQLAGAVAGPLLVVDNNGSGPAMDLRVEPGKAPLRVNATAGKATNLDADRIDGQDASAFLPAGGKARDAETLDGKDSADFARAYKRTVVVSPTGTPQENGAALRGALAGITDASGEKPHLLKLEPGVYDLGAGWMAMKEWVDIEGSGEGSTRITGQSYSSQPYDGTIFMRSNADLRSLTVENTGGGYSATAIAFNTNSGSDLVDVTVRASGASAFNTGLYISNSSPRIEDSTVTAAYALDVEYDGTTTVDGSEITGSVSADGSHNSNNAPDVRIGASKVDGQVSTRLGATLKCAASFNRDYAPLTAGCTP